MNEAALISELTNDPLNRGYAEMTDQEVYDSLKTVNITELYQRFISLRGVAAILSNEEYAAFKAFLSSVASQGARYADMIAMLEKPCSDDGDTGGLDFGCAGVRALLDGFGQVEGMATAAANLKALAEHLVSRDGQLGIGARMIDVIRTRRGM